MAEPPPRFADVVARHRAEILRYLVRLLGDVEDARDACQETMLRAHVAFPRLRPDSNPRAWLFRIATNAARNTGRSRTRRARRTADVELDGLPAAAVASPDPHAGRRGGGASGGGCPVARAGRGPAACGAGRGCAAAAAAGGTHAPPLPWARLRRDRGERGRDRDRRARQCLSGGPEAQGGAGGRSMTRDDDSLGR